MPRTTPHTSQPAPHAIDAVYQAPNEGTLVLYAGDLIWETPKETHTAYGEVHLSLEPSANLTARFAGPLRSAVGAIGLGDDLTVSVPLGADLSPPPNSSLPEQPKAIKAWTQRAVPLNVLEAGDHTRSDSFLLHVSGGLEVFCRAEQTADGRYQHRLPFSLPGWDLVLAPLKHAKDDTGFKAIVQALPTGSQPTAEELDDLQERLFILLSFVAGREIGIAPICGLDDSGRIVWAKWATTRMRGGRAGVRWCPDILTGSAIPSVANGMARIASQPTTEAVVKRAINHLLSANGSEVLDVRIPVGCSGLELLAWAVLQSELGVERKTVEGLSAGQQVRQLVEWATIPVAIPNEFTALHSRRKALGRPDWEGPETLFGVRNKLVHPPNRIESPEWPTADELLESWQLATWYLELAILRVLGYSDRFWSRLRLGRLAADVEPVPWTDLESAGHAS